MFGDVVASMIDLEELSSKHPYGIDVKIQDGLSAQLKGCASSNEFK